MLAEAGHVAAVGTAAADMDSIGVRAALVLERKPCQTRGEDGAQLGRSLSLPGWLRALLLAPQSCRCQG